LTQRILLVCLAVILGLAVLIFKKNFTPGPVSAASPRGELLGGYESHAEFERDCLVCHEPVHCLSADRCQRCHENVAEERAQASGLHGDLPGTDKCQTCHSEHQGSEQLINDFPAVHFDHQLLTGFSLVLHRTDYGGNPLVCDGCHLGGRLTPEAVDCIPCHADADPVYMAEHQALFGDACFDCHDGLDRMIDFDHELVFSLAGSHSEVACIDCHPDQVFVGSPSDCVACHEEPGVHAGQFGLDCARCHGSSAWTPAQLTVHPFPLDHGAEENLACETCHVGAYVAHTCYGCHDHQPAQTAQAHAEREVLEIDRCYDCHPTGQAAEAAQRVHDYFNRNGGGQDDRS